MIIASKKSTSGAHQQVGFTSFGFTLIELMVVIAIIGILSAIMVANFTAAKAKSRDTKRLSDLSQIQLALAGYFDRCNAYPSNINDLVTTCPAGVSLGTFISKIPTPPNLSEYYYYVTDAISAPDDYFLHATLEGNNTASNNSITVTPSDSDIVSVPSGGSTSVTIVCTGATDYCVGPK